MKLRKSTWIAIVILLVWCLLTWRLAHAIAPHPPVLYYLRIGFLLIGGIGLAGYLLLRPKEPGEAAQGWTAMANAEIEFSFSEATKRMQAAGVKNINTLASVFILGDAGTAKTSVIAKSGLEPDLLAGYAYEEYVIAPTRSLNLWFARQTLYIDPAGAVISDPEVRKKLFKKFAPVKLKSILGGKQPPPRSVVFTVDCDTFLQQGSGDALAAKARQFQTILGELSQELGSNFPVYVLFTKTDRLPYFREYVANFTEAEATEIFGKTLPLQLATERGVYAEQETRRLTEAFQDLYYTLCDLPAGAIVPRTHARSASKRLRISTGVCQASSLIGAVPGGPLPPYAVANQPVSAGLLLHWRTPGQRARSGACVHHAAC